MLQILQNFNFKGDGPPFLKRGMGTHRNVQLQVHRGRRLPAFCHVLNLVLFKIVDIPGSTTLHTVHNKHLRGRTSFIT